MIAALVNGTDHFTPLAVGDRPKKFAAGNQLATTPAVAIATAGYVGIEAAHLTGANVACVG